MSRQWTPADVYLGALRSLTFVRETPKNSNRGQAVEAFLKACGLGPGQPWCMAVLSYVGRQCFSEAWPLPMTASCATAANAARAAGLVVPAAEARVGDMVLMWFPKLGRVAHAYVITGPKTPKGEWPTLEGNTNDGGSREGWGMFARRRVIAPQDVVVRWSAGL